MKKLLISLSFALCIVAGASSQELFSQRTLQSQREIFASALRDSIACCNHSAMVQPTAVAGLVWRIAAFNRYDEASRAIIALKHHFDTLSAQEQYAVISLLYDRHEELSVDELRWMNNRAKDKKTSELIRMAIQHREGLLSAEQYELDETQFNLLKQVTLDRGIPVLLLRADRNLPGVLVVPQGSDMEPVTLNYLGRSAYNTPTGMLNGNTPCGVYAVEGWDVSENVFIGPVPSLITRLPFEVGAECFGATSCAWNESFYRSLFPEPLQQIEMIWQAYRAGQNGRGEIIVHGSTIDPEFFAGTTFYPLTPSMGCMTARERWDPVSGRLVEGGSDQLKLYHVLDASVKFLYVVQIKQQLISLYQ